MIFVYFDKNGVIKETINDNKTRVGNSHSDRIYFYFEDELNYDNLFITLKRPDNSVSNEISIHDNYEQDVEIPYDKKRDLKYFENYKKYKFYFYELTSEDTKEEGLCVATIRAILEHKIYAQGLLTFNVQKNIIKEDHNITQSQYDYLISLISSGGSVGTSGIKDGSVTTNKIKDKNVTENKLSDEVQTKLNKKIEIGQGSITSTELGSNAVTSDKIYNGAVTTEKIANSNITENKLAPNSVTTAKILDGSITFAKLNDSVKSAINSGSGTGGNFEIGQETITSKELATNSVITSKIADENVTENKLAPDSVTTNKILNENVTSEKLATDSVTTAKILNGNVTEKKLSQSVQDKLNKTFKPAENSLNANVLIDESITQDKLNSEVLNLIGNAGMTIKGRAYSIYYNNNPYAEGLYPNGTLLDERNNPMKKEDAIKGDTYIIGATLYKFDKKVNEYSTFIRVCDLIGDRSISGWDIKLNDIGNELLKDNTISRDKLNFDLKKELDWYASATNSFVVTPDTTESDNQWTNLPFGTYRFLPTFNLIENYGVFYIDINYIYNDMSGVQQNKTIRISNEEFADYNTYVSKFVNVKAKLSTFLRMNKEGRRYEECYISVIITTESGDLIKKYASFEMYENDYRNLNISFIYGESLYSFSEQSQLDDELNKYLPDFAKKNRIRSELELDDYIQEGIYNLVKTYEIDNSVIPITLKVEYKDEELYQYYRVEDGTKESGYFTRKMKPKEIEDENGDYSFKDIEWEYVKDTKFKDFILNEDIELNPTDPNQLYKMIVDYVIRNKTIEDNPIFINRKYYITQSPIEASLRRVNILDMIDGNTYHSDYYRLDTLPENIDDITITWGTTIRNIIETNTEYLRRLYFVNSDNSVRGGRIFYNSYEKELEIHSKNPIGIYEDIEQQRYVRFEKNNDIQLVANFGDTIMKGTEIETIKSKLDNLPVFEKEVASNSYEQVVPNNALDYSLVEEIGGMSYESENLIVLDDVEETTLNGITYSIKNGVITLNGATTSTDKSFHIVTHTLQDLPSGDYSLGVYGMITDKWAITTLVQNKSYTLLLNINKNINTKGGTFNGSPKFVEIKIDTQAVFDNHKFCLKLVKGTTIPTIDLSTFENGYSGFYNAKVERVAFEQKNLIQLQEGTESSEAFTAEIDKNGWITINKTAGNGDLWLTLVNEGELNIPKGKSYSARVRYYDEKIPDIGVVVFLYEGVRDTPTTRFMTLGYTDGSGYSSEPMYANKNIGKIYIYCHNSKTITNAKFKVEMVENDFMNDSIKIPNENVSLKWLGVNAEDGNYNCIRYHEEDGKYYYHQNIASYTFTGNEILYDTGTQGGTALRLGFTGLINVIAKPSSSRIKGIIKFEGLETLTADATFLKNNGVSVDAQSGYVHFFIDTIQTVDEMKAYLTGKTLIYKLATPEVIDISEYMNDEYLQVQENGSVKFVNEKQKAVPNKITYAIKVV